jgi:hypothetical protein
MRLSRFLPPILASMLREIAERRQHLRLSPISAVNGPLAGTERGRCFIIGSGPSIGGLDLSRLSPFGTIALNHLIAHPHYDALEAKHHLIAPLHPPQTESQWTSWLGQLDRRVHATTRFWAGVGDGPISAQAIIERCGMFRAHRTCYYPVMAQSAPSRANRVDFSRPLATALAASVYALGLALWLGYDEIVLLGIDHSYFLFEDVQAGRFYRDADHQVGENSDRGTDDYIREFSAIAAIFSAYLQLSKEAQVRGATIVSASDRRVNKMFPQVDWERAIDPRSLHVCTK